MPIRAAVLRRRQHLPLGLQIARPSDGDRPMLLRSIRSRLLVLVLATVVPFVALVGIGLWSQWQEDQAAAIERALNEARLLAAQLDDHLSNLENLLAGLSQAVSTNPADTSANDAVLRQTKAKLPDFVGNILLYSLDGTNIGTSTDFGAGRPHGNERAYFQRVLTGQRLAIGDVVRTRITGQWAVGVGYPVEDQEGRLRGVLTIGTWLKLFQDAFRMKGLPPGSVVRIVNEHGIVVAQSENGPNWIGRDLSNSEHVARHLAAKEASEIEVWADDIQRITGSSTAHQAPWLVSVGLPMDLVFATLGSRLAWGALLGTSA